MLIFHSQNSYLTTINKVAHLAHIAKTTSRYLQNYNNNLLTFTISNVVEWKNSV